LQFTDNETKMPQMGSEELSTASELVSPLGFLHKTTYLLM